MRLSQRRGLLGGLALVACAAVLLETVLARLYSAILGPHTAIAAVPLPLFGLALGGALLHVFPAITRPPRLYAGLAYLACAASVTSAIAMIVVVQPRWVEAIMAPSAGLLAILYLASLLPFLFTGAALAGTAPYQSSGIGKVISACLAGAVLGKLVAILALPVGAPRAGLIAAVIAGAAAVVFYAAAGAQEDASARRASGGIVATFALGSAVLLAGDIGAPWLKVPGLRWMRTDKVEHQRWSVRSLITVERPQAGVAYMQSDGAAATAILEAKKTPDAHPTDMAYAIHRDRGPVLVIDAAGGIDIRRALKAGQKEILASEPDPTIVDGVMRDKYRAFSGELYDRPEVRVAVADGRSFVRSSNATFRAIVLGFPDSWQATSVGALSLIENNLYTVEAFREYIERLSPEGTLLVSRWEIELDRLLALAATGLRGAGAESPKDHLFACSQERMASLLIKRSPLTKEEIRTLRSTCRKSRFQEVFAPDVQRSDLRGRIATTPNIRAAAPDHPSDLTVPTDDRPFFFLTVPAHTFHRALLSPRALARDNQGMFAAALVFAAAAALAVFLLVAPLIAGRERVFGVDDRWQRVRSLFFFMSLGAGSALALPALAQHAATILGRPPYALPIVIAVFLLTAAVSAHLADRIETFVAALAAGRRAQLLTALLAVYAVGHTVAAAPLLRIFTPLPFVAKVALAGVLLAPIGLLVGSLMPLGAKLVAGRAPGLVAWCFGLGGVAGAGAVALGALLAAHLGYSALLLAGGLAYLIASALVPPAPQPRYAG